MLPPGAKKFISARDLCRPVELPGSKGAVSDNYTRGNAGCLVRRLNNEARCIKTKIGTAKPGIINT